MDIQKIKCMLFESAKLKREYYKRDTEKYAYHVGREEGLEETLLAMGYTIDQIWNKDNFTKKEVKKVNRPYFEMIVKKVKRLKEKHSSLTEITIDGKKYTLSKDKDENVYFHKEEGNWVNGERIDKIKFPCFCSYKDNIYHHRSYGILIKHGGNFKIIPIEKQYRVLSYPYSEDLSCFIKNWKIHILKGKIIIFEEEKSGTYDDCIEW